MKGNKTGMQVDIAETIWHLNEPWYCWHVRVPITVLLVTHTNYIVPQVSKLQKVDCSVIILLRYLCPFHEDTCNEIIECLAVGWCDELLF